MKNFLTGLLGYSFVSLLCCSLMQAIAGEWIRLELKGSDEPLEVERINDDSIALRSIPQNINGEFKILSVESLLGVQVNGPFCKTVETRVGFATDKTYPAEFKNHSWESIRELNEIRLSLRVVPFTDTPEWKTWLQDALPYRIVHGRIPLIVNPYRVAAVKIALTFQEGALSSKLGHLEEMNQWIQSNSNAVNPISGDLVIVLKQADLVCDLFSGKAKLVLEVLGNLEDTTEVPDRLSATDLTYIMSAFTNAEQQRSTFFDDAQVNLMLAGALMHKNLDWAPFSGQKKKAAFRFVIDHLLDPEKCTPKTLMQKEKQSLMATPSRKPPLKTVVKLTPSHTLSQA